MFVTQTFTWIWLCFPFLPSAIVVGGEAKILEFFSQFSFCGRPKSGSQFPHLFT